MQNLRQDIRPARQCPIPRRNTQGSQTLHLQARRLQQGLFAAGQHEDAPEQFPQGDVAGFNGDVCQVFPDGGGAA